jgi:glutathione synthase/RimK-type ligase-like ATP-grasp enzyme
MKRIALLTKNDLDGFISDDELLKAPLKAAGFSMESVSWHKTQDWAQYAAVIIRSTWDYQDHYADFIKVLEEISSKTILLNNLEKVKWNSHKSYLKELKAKGIKIIPTLFHEELMDLSSEQLCEKLDTDKIIFKPYVGANSDNAYPILSGQELPTIDLKSGNFFVQAFVENVLTEGEFSLFFFRGEYSHCILKTPKAGDYRVQEEWGGHIQEVTPEEDLLKTAMTVVDSDLLYCRVDLVRGKSGFELMELELIEPALYFRTNKGSAALFAKNLKKSL